MKKVLLVAFYFPPMGGGGITRPLKFTKYLPGYGWQPVVLTAKPHHYWFRDERRLVDIPPGTEVHRTRALTGIHVLKKLWRKKPDTQTSVSRDSGSMNRFRRLAGWFLIPDSFIGWLPFAVLRGVRVCRRLRPDVIFATSPPPTALAVGYLISKLTGIPLVTDFRDLWTEDMHFNPPTPCHRRTHQFLERIILRHSDRVTFINERMMDMMSHAYPESESFSVIRSGYDPEDMENVNPETSLPRKPFRFVHTGNLTLNRPIEGLLQAIRELIDENRISEHEAEFHFYGQRDDHNDRLIGQYQLTRVFSHANVTHAESLQLQASADGLLFMGYDTNEKTRCVTTGKIYEYLYWANRFGKSILALSSPCDATDLIERNSAGLITPMRDVPAIKAALCAILRGTPPVKRAGDLSADRFSIRHSAGRLAEIFDEIIRSGPKQKKQD